MGCLIDTNLWIAVERGSLGAADIHAVTQQEPVFISPVNIAEIQFGAEMIANAAQRQKAQAMLRRLRRKPLLRITGETAEVFGTLAADLSKRGHPHHYRINDLWLAAQAIQRAFKLLTSNAKDFRDIPGLDLVVMPAD